ncbi:pectin lyase-like protein [Aspergillus niger CBS 101883]|uniref:pectin lyase-like protein n=1 Tax=Aspergillus lacticoffeatus (strain CBS 101883) TaxID=1450533 RepID=UPI000D7F16C0|nr:pectin lyase-like protein [Aspergillus niger CBS 101883]PYH62029.1 pectin lyase-like protein [Aspergillus niger CBS 101883]
MTWSTSFLVATSLLSIINSVHAQLTGSVGPLTSVIDKAAVKTCNVCDYGASSDNTTGVGQPIIDAFTDCGSGGLIHVPEGDYLLKDWVSSENGSAWSIQLDGVLHWDSSPSAQSYIFAITGGSDSELSSSNATGAIQGSGYLYHRHNTYTSPRMLYISGSYNMAICGGDHGGLDGIDLPNSHNFLIENIYCNPSGGCAIGSLGSSVNVTNILYRNVYTWDSNQMMMIKTNGGLGNVSNIVFENFIGHGNVNSLDLDSYWSSMNAIDGVGIYYHNITIYNWTGTAIDGETRPPIRVICPEDMPCTEITLVQIDLLGYCLDSATSTLTTYTTTTYGNSASTGYEAPTMADDLATAFGTTASIPTPTTPASFFPGVAPVSAVAGSS